MTSATEILRRMLDERGVEWDRGKLAMLDDEYTQWWVSDRMEGFVAYECDYPLNTLIVRGITPEQAIAATLGAGTCKRVMDSIDPFAMWVCDHCGHPLDTSENFCGGCGRKVVSE